MSFNRYDVHWVDLEPVRGRELSKSRPAVIVSLDMLNQALGTLVICPLTATLHPTWRSRIEVRVGGKRGEIAADQIRVVTKARVGDKIGALSSGEAESLRRLLTEMYGEP